jgi:hypothetical protein
MSTPPEFGPRERRYRFGPRPETGWVLGLAGAQCVALAIGVVGAGVLLNRQVALPIDLLPLLAACGFAFGTWRGEPLHEFAPTLVAWMLATIAGQTEWVAPISALLARHPRPSDHDPGLVFPAPLDGLSLHPGGPASDIGVVVDRRDHTATVVIRAQATEFSLCEPAEQDRLVGLWGDVLSGFCTERSPVSRIRWLEWSGPGGLDSQLTYLHERGIDPHGAAGVAYREMVDQAGPFSARHEVLIVVTVDEQRLHRTTRTGQRRTVEDAAVDEARAVIRRLEAAGLNPSSPLTVGELTAIFRSRLDPYHAPGTNHAGGSSLATLVGFVPPADAGPIAVNVAWDHVQVDGAFHAGFVIREWPRLEVPANWMEPLILHAGGIRTIAMHYEPVPPSRSSRRIDRESVKLASDEDQRSRAGFRIGARHRRAADEVTEREHELVSGFAELEYVGFVIVTARTLDELADSSLELEQRAAQCGLEVRRLDGRHDLALASALPVGRGLTPRRRLP